MLKQKITLPTNASGQKEADLTQWLLALMDPTGGARKLANAMGATDEPESEADGCKEREGNGDHQT
jgi:hypothetical protein